MRYLLDVNALVALGFLEHQFHNRVTNWMNDLISKGVPQVASLERSFQSFQTARAIAYSVVLMALLF